MRTSEKITHFAGYTVFEMEDEFDLPQDSEIRAALADWFPSEDALDRITVDMALQALEGSMH